MMMSCFVMALYMSYAGLFCPPELGYFPIPMEECTLYDRTMILPVDGTVYWAVESQTDSTPTITAFGHKVDSINPPRFIALSEDLEAFYDPGDTVTVIGHPDVSGDWIFADRMHKRWKNKVDFLVPKNTWGRYKVVLCL